MAPSWGQVATPIDAVTWPTVSTSVVERRTRTRSAALIGPDVIGAGKEQRELLAAEARHHVGVAAPFPERGRHVADGGVAGRVAEGVVHLLQVVDVHEDEGEGQAGAPRPSQLAPQRFREAAPVGELGELVRGRHLAEGEEEPRVLHAERDLLGDVAQELDGGAVEVLVAARGHEADAAPSSWSRTARGTMSRDAASANGWMCMGGGVLLVLEEDGRAP